MPIFVKAHRQANHLVRAYTRNGIRGLTVTRTKASKALVKARARKQKIRIIKSEEHLVPYYQHLRNRRRR